MNSTTTPSQTPLVSTPDTTRLDYLDATRAFALVLGIVFHASLSFSPFFMGWAVQDISTSSLIPYFATVSHSFRMETFFLLAGFLGCVVVQRKGLGEFVRTRCVRIGVPFVVGWFILRPLVVSGWLMGAASLKGDYGFWSGIRSGFETLKSLPAGLFTGSHLWFLYYLALITALTLLLRGVFAMTGSTSASFLRQLDAFVGWLARSPFSLGVLIVPTAVALWYMRYWGMDTPDQSLRPEVPVLAIYGGFFLFGWMLGRQPEAISAFARLTVARWILALLSAVASVRLSAIQGDPGHPYHTAAHVGFTLSYAVMMWTLVPLTLGLFKTFCRRPRASVRYVADSSYWMYLIHLPIVVWLQVALAEAGLNWSVKLALICTLTVAIGLLTYDAFVRSTFIGAVLNGRRRDRALPELIARLSPRSHHPHLKTSTKLPRSESIPL
jgi:glucan biosynthesis protein C